MHLPTRRSVILSIFGLFGLAFVGAGLADEPAAPCIDLSGKWSGCWRDHGTGHHGPLHARIHKIDDCHYKATFSGTFRKVIPFVYSVELTVTGREGDRLLLTGTHRSSLTGRCYEYTATATECEF